MRTIQLSIITILLTATAIAEDGATLVSRETPLGSAELEIVPGSLLVSPDERHLAFVARRGNERLVILDGVPGKGYDQIGEHSLLFSFDSAHIAYAAQDGNQWRVVVDSNEENAYEALRGITFSPDSQHVGYFASQGNSWFAVINGKAGKKYDDAGEMTFSPNGRRAAYAAGRGRNWILVTDDAESKEFDAVRSIVFSPDSKRIACAVQHGQSWRVVVDGVEGAEYDGLRQGNGVAEINRGAFGALNANPAAVGIDDILGDSAPVFSPDSSRVAYWARRGDLWRVVVDGAESNPYDGYLRGSHIAFVKPNLLRALAVKGSDAVRLDIELK